MDDFAESVVRDLTEMSQADLTREQYNSLYEVIHRDCVRLAKADQLYFVLGNYEEQTGQRGRLETVRDTISDYPCFEAFLMEEIDPDNEAWENWWLKFQALLNRADYAILVLEDNEGGHELEAGELNLEETYVLKRDYLRPDGSLNNEVEHARYDGMLAHKLKELESRGRVYNWTLHQTGERDTLDRATRRMVEDSR